MLEGGRQLPLQKEPSYQRPVHFENIRPSSLGGKPIERKFLCKTGIHDFLIQGLQSGVARGISNRLESGHLPSARFHAECYSPSTRIPLTSAQVLRKLEQAATMTTSMISPSLRP